MALTQVMSSLVFCLSFGGCGLNQLVGVVCTDSNLPSIKETLVVSKAQPTQVGWSYNYLFKCVGYTKARVKHAYIWDIT